MKRPGRASPRRRWPCTPTRPASRDTPASNGSTAGVSRGTEMMARFHQLLFVAALLAVGSAAAPAETEAPATSPLDRVKPLVDARRLEEAERLARQLLAEATESHDADSMECARALDALVHAQLAEADPPFDEVQRNAERAVAIKKARLKEPTLDFATSLNNLGRVRMRVGAFEPALD